MTTQFQITRLNAEGNIEILSEGVSWVHTGRGLLVRRRRDALIPLGGRRISVAVPFFGDAIDDMDSDAMHLPYPLMAEVEEVVTAIEGAASTVRKTGVSASVETRT